MRLAVITVTCFVVAFGLMAASGAQKPDPFTSMPQAQRDRLKTRLAEFVELHRTKQWNKVYDFLAERSKQASAGGLPKDLFLKKKLYSKVKKFTPTAVQQIEALDSWTIWGCATYDDGTMESAVEAYEQNGDWFFSDIWSSPPCVDCKPRGCKH